jgi:NAD(P)-dependent dehydrogenase (short-subunit alcohol dehydrogenase family)
VDRTVQQFGRLDIAFNNAGVLERGLTTDVTTESYEHIFGINVRGVVLSLKHQITAMSSSGTRRNDSNCNYVASRLEPSPPVALGFKAAKHSAALSMLRTLCQYASIEMVYDGNGSCTLSSTNDLV